MVTAAARALPPPIFDIEAALARLPAEKRKTVQWVRPPIESALRRLYEADKLDDQLVDSVADELVPAMANASAEIWGIVGENQDGIRAWAMSDFEVVGERLRAFLQDEDAQDTLLWVIGLLQSMTDLFMNTLAPQPNIAEAVRQAWTHASATELHRGMPGNRATISFMAVNEVARTGGDPARAEELLNYAFLELMRFRENLRHDGISLAPFPRETHQERQERQARALADFRKSVTLGDLHAIDQARVRNLR